MRLSAWVGGRRAGKRVWAWRLEAKAPLFLTISAKSRIETLVGVSR